MPTIRPSITRVLLAAVLVAAVSVPVAAQNPAQKAAQELAPELVDLELMTYAEVASALQRGKTTVLIYNGGTEQRGPHAVLGGHTFIAHRASVAIAQTLGNALVAPVLPFSPAGSHLNLKTPGSVQLFGPVFSAVNEAVVDSMVVNGFTTIILMGDHGGGQRDLEALALRLDRKYAPTGHRVYFCGDVYQKTEDDVNAWLKMRGLPPTTHAGVQDTSVLMFLGADAYVRKDKVLQNDPPPTAELGRMFFEMQVENAVSQIRALTRAK